MVNIGESWGSPVRLLNRETEAPLADFSSQLIYKMGL